MFAGPGMAFPVDQRESVRGASGSLSTWEAAVLEEAFEIDNVLVLPEAS